MYTTKRKLTPVYHYRQQQYMHSKITPFLFSIIPRSYMNYEAYTRHVRPGLVLNGATRSLKKFSQGFAYTQRSVLDPDENALAHAFPRAVFLCTILDAGQTGVQISMSNVSITSWSSSRCVRFLSHANIFVGYPKRTLLLRDS